MQTKQLHFIDFKLLTRHTDASEGTRVVETGAIVSAGMALALVDVGLTPGSRESDRAVARERSWRVHADAVVLTWRP